MARLVIVVASPAGGGNEVDQGGLGLLPATGLETAVLDSMD